MTLSIHYTLYSINYVIIQRRGNIPGNTKQVPARDSAGQTIKSSGITSVRFPKSHAFVRVDWRTWLGYNMLHPHHPHHGHNDRDHPDHNQGQGNCYCYLGICNYFSFIDNIELNWNVSVYSSLGDKGESFWLKLISIYGTPWICVSGEILTLFLDTVFWTS